MASMSGCVNEGTTTEKTFENIDFESDVVKLDNANLAFIKDDEEYGSVRSVELKYFLHNPHNRYVTFVVNVVFYDVNGHELYSNEPYTYKDFPAKYTEPNLKYTSDPTILIDGSMARAVDHVMITAYEKIEWFFYILFLPFFIT